MFEQVYVEKETTVTLNRLQRFWYMVPRVIFLIGYIVNILTLGLFNYAAAPIISFLFFNDFRFWRHIRKFRLLTISSFRHLVSVITNPAHNEVSKVPWTAPPMVVPDLNRVSISKAWREEHGESCAGCVSCCKIAKCDLIDHESSGCLVYGSFYWNYFCCGRFPATQKQIEFYECTKWQENKFR